MLTVAQQRPRVRMQPRGRAVRWAVARWELLGLLVAVSLCLWLRLVGLNALPIFIDEVDTIRAALAIGSDPGPTTWLISMYAGVYPLFPWVATLFVRLMPDPFMAVRCASACIGVVGLLAIWGVGRELAGARGGLLAALLYAVCPYLLFHNRLAVPDGLVATCGAGSLLFAIRLAKTARGRDAFLLGLCLALGLLTKAFAFSMLLLPLLAVVAALPARRRRTRVLSMAATLCAVVPFAWLLISPISTEHRLQVQERFVAVSTMPPIIAHQFATLCAALWVQVTAPILFLALAGLWSVRRERVAWVIGPWALLSGLPRVLVPTAYITPRHLVYVAVPVLALAACGLVALLDAAARRGWTHRAVWPVVLAALCLGLASAPSVAADATMITAPARTPLVAFDRWQYISGWPSGYVAGRVASYLRRQAALEPLTVLMPPGYFVSGPLEVLLYGDRRVTISIVPPTLLSTRLPPVVQGRATFVLTYQPSHGALTLDRRRLRRVLHVETGDHDGVCDLYRIVR